jgi:hypothetical protein
MALLDVAAVTRTLLNVLTDGVTGSPAWPSAPGSPGTPLALHVLPLPPDKLVDTPSVGLYLYHLTENAYCKNQPPPDGVTELRYTPMGLDLYYVLSANGGDDTDGILRAQLIMGLSVKALRDYPCINDDTMVGSTLVLDKTIRGGDNRLHISLQPVPAAEAVSYWTAGASPLRLSAYYQATVVMLEPDKTPRGAGRVLSYGVQVFLSGTPRLDTSQSVVTFRVPGETQDRSITVQPAQVTQLGAGDPFTLLGSGLSGGTATLLLRQISSTTTLTADAAWQLQITDEGASARAQTTASGTPVLPGLYAASIRVARPMRSPDGSVQQIEQVSNEVPIAIAPGISAVSTPDAQQHFTISGLGFDPQTAVSAYLGAARADAGTMPLAPGEIEAVNSKTLEARLPAGLSSGDIVPVRVIVSGSEAPPRWVVVP